MLVIHLSGWIVRGKVSMMRLGIKMRGCSEVRWACRMTVLSVLLSK